VYTLPLCPTFYYNTSDFRNVKSNLTFANSGRIDIKQAHFSQTKQPIPFAVAKNSYTPEYTPGFSPV